MRFLHARRSPSALLSIDGVRGTIMLPGYDAASNTNAPNAATAFIPLKPFEERSRSANAILADARKATADIDEATVMVIPPPLIDGIGLGRRLSHDGAGPVTGTTAGPGAVQARQGLMRPGQWRPPTDLRQVSTASSTPPRPGSSPTSIEARPGMRDVPPERDARSAADYYLGSASSPTTSTLRRRHLSRSGPGRPSPHRGSRTPSIR